MKINKYHIELPLTHVENKVAPVYDPSREHPTPEQLLLREALNVLSDKQRDIWELWNYDKLTQDEIAKKVKMHQPHVAREIKKIEAMIAKWVKSNIGAYKLLKSDLGPK